MIEYPKIETLYDRDEKFIVDPTKVRCQEFLIPKSWYTTEKIDGMNIRVGYTGGPGCNITGRTDRADLPKDLRAYLNATFTQEKMGAVFPTGEVILFGEAYGPKIQSGGSYRKDIAFRLFDVWVDGWWLEPDSIEDIAFKLDIKTVPVIWNCMRDFTPICSQDLDNLLGLEGASWVAREDGGSGCRAEGIVARTVPSLFTRKGQRLMWKLKYKDFGK